MNSFILMNSSLPTADHAVPPAPAVLLELDRGSRHPKLSLKQRNVLSILVIVDVIFPIFNWLSPPDTLFKII